MSVTWSSRPTLEAGAYPTGTEVEQIVDEIDQRGIIARANRTTNSTGFTTSETSVVRLDSVLIKANRLYVVHTNAIQMFSTVSGDTIKVNIRYTTDSTSATTSSTVLITGYERAHVAGSAGGGMMTLYDDLAVATADYRLSVLLTGTRNTGTGTCNLLANIKMFVSAFGDDPGDAGFDL